MSRRSTAEPIDEARRAATRNRLIGERVTEATAEACVRSAAPSAEWPQACAQGPPVG